MRPRTLALAIVLAMALIAWLGFHGLAWSYNLSFPEAVKTCVGYTNSVTDRTYNRPVEAFATYNKRIGHYVVTIWSNQYELFVFEKCMSEMGQPLDAQRR